MYIFLSLLSFFVFLVASVNHFRIFSFSRLSFYTGHNFLVGGEPASNFIKEVNIGPQPCSMCILSFSYAKFPLSLICVESSSYVFIDSVPNSVKTPNININLVYKVFIVAWWASCMKFWCFLVASSTFFVNESINIVQSVVAIAESDSYFSFGEVEALGSQPHFFVRRKVIFSRYLTTISSFHFWHFSSSLWPSNVYMSVAKLPMQWTSTLSGSVSNEIHQPFLIIITRGAPSIWGEKNIISFKSRVLSICGFPEEKHCVHCLLCLIVVLVVLLVKYPNEMLA